MQIPTSERFNEPYDGCLVVMNVGENTALVGSQEDAIRGEVDNAHARGWLVIYAFDSRIGVSKPPESIEMIEGMDFPVLAKSIFGMDVIKFNYRYGETKEFSDFASKIFSGEGLVKMFTFTEPSAKIVGFATVDDGKVFIPPMAI